MRHASFAALILLAGCSPHAGHEPTPGAGYLELRRSIWAALKPMAASRGLDPQFVYAVVKLESDFDARARRGEARGLLQIKPQAWKEVSDLPYEPSVWEVGPNLTVGLDHLAATKRALEAKGVFSYALLWAAYHYGYDFVAARGFDITRIPRPSDPIAYRLWSGDPHPVRPPI